MAKVVFLLDLEEGHILPTFSFAKSLKRAGYEVAYLAFPDAETLIRKAGFEFHPLFPNHYPKGFKDKYNALVVNDDHRGFDRHLGDFSNGTFDKTLAAVKGDIYIVSSFLTIEALFLYYRYNVKPVILSPRLYDSNDPLCDICAGEMVLLPPDETMHLLDLVATRHLKYSTFQELVAPLATFTHLILCAKDLDKSTITHNSQTFYLGCGGNQHTDASIVSEEAGRKIIYASMGSQAYMYRDKFSRLYSQLVQIMKRDEMKGYHLIFSLGGGHLDSPPDLTPPNVTVAKWVDQRNILAQSCLAIIHGGLSSVKECIYARVPMIVIPGARDQPINAQRVEEHGLGIMVDILTTSSDGLFSRILSVLENEKYEKNLAEMKREFEEEDQREVGVSVINKILSGIYVQ